MGKGEFPYGDTSGRRGRSTPFSGDRTNDWLKMTPMYQKDPGFMRIRQSDAQEESEWLRAG
jgi:hypothetical protein